MRELSLHILDAFENSRVAGASLIRLEINEDTKKDRLEITITDNGRGMEPELAAKVFDPFVTTRTCRKVGLGLPLLKAAAQRCNGDARITSAPGKGATLHACFQLSHIDRAPLGNLVESLVVFLAANPEMDLVYTHRVDENEFTLDTRELRAELEGVPLNTPAVLNWIRGYLQEGLQEINSTA
ncbi:MAG: ATP-binding protein [Firmicutes bacterium]|nr:ATP-binding protein [Bacillota bacterium]